MSEEERLAWERVEKAAGEEPVTLVFWLFKQFAIALLSLRRRVDEVR
jgi:hypothetical protein